MSWPRTLVISLLLLAGSLLWIASVPEAVNSAGAAHPRIEAMRIGGDPERHRDLLLPAWAFGVAGLGVCFGLMALGLRPAARRGVAVWMFAMAALQTAVFSGVVLAYENQMGSAEPVLVLGLPLATAWMLWAMWPAPVLFVVLFVSRFERVVLSPDDERRFAEILARRAARGRGEEGGRG